MSSIRYQSHVDGLRSFAILPVLLHHADVSIVSGGYVGVDIFFVISGYLITGIMTREMESGRFSLLGFYRRRVLRIVPLLITVLVAVLVAGWIVMFPSELRELGESAVAAALMVANIYFYLSIDYFDSPAQSVPLLHMWSLGVEEQFYVFFPLLLLALHRWARSRIVLMLAVLTAASLVLSIFGTELARFATFYLLPTRAWELGLGCLLAVAGTPKGIGRRGREFLSWAGMLLVIAPMFYLTPESAFPGANAIPPVLGAALLIGFAEGTSMGRILQWRPLVYIGLISYALYLWHWPVIVFDRLITGPDLDWFDRLRVIAISLVLAALSRPLIEQPFRTGLKAVSSSRVVVVGVAAMVVVALVGVGLMRDAVPSRSYPADVVALAAYGDYESTDAYRQQFRSGTCFIEDEYVSGARFDTDACLRLDSTRPNVLIAGDSHAAHLWGGLQAEYPGINFLQATHVGCRAVLASTGLPACAALMAEIFNDFIPTHRLDGVILAGRWQPEDIAGIAETAVYLQRYADHVMVVGPTVEYGAAVPTLLARAEVWGGGADTLSHARSEGPLLLDAELAPAIAATGADYRSPIAIICPGGTCQALAAPGIPMQFDYGHLTEAGSQLVARHLIGDWLTEN